jgi:uncharacterized membrane protein YtjA (UPF0391 family)
MLRWTLVSLIAAMVAAIIGFTGIGGDIAWIAQILFAVALLFAVLSLLFGALMNKKER